MPVKLAINGYGRIGRSVLRALVESGYQDRMQIVAINELADCKTIAHLTKYDSTHGRFPGEVSTSAGMLTVNGQNIAVFHQQNITELDWAALDVDVVLECSGAFSIGWLSGSMYMVSDGYHFTWKTDIHPRDSRISKNRLAWWAKP